MRTNKQGKREPASRPAPGLETQEGSQQERLYFAYGSNMDLLQMDYRCPAAEVIGNVRLMDYRLTFCSRNPDSGVATIVPTKEVLLTVFFGASLPTAKKFKSV